MVCYDTFYYFSSIVKVYYIAGYAGHRDCLHRVGRSIDCNVAYPQALPIIPYTVNTGAWYPRVSSAHNVEDSADLIGWGISTHL